MQPVDGDEILGQRVGRAVVVRHGLRDAGRGVRVDQPDAELGQPVIGRRAVPVGVEPDVDGLGRQDRRRPFDRVDLGDQRRDDQPRRLIDALVAPARIVRAQLVAEQVVLAREQRVQRAQAEPPALVEAGDLHAACIDRQVAVVKPDLGAFAQCCGRLRVGAVDLGAVPPMRRGVAEDR